MQRQATAATTNVRAPAVSTARRVGDALSPRSTPGSFRLAATVVTAICALCGVLGATMIAGRASALDDAATAARQLVDVQEVRTAAVEADAIAASAFLVGGQEPADLRLAYESRLADATRRLAAVAQRAPASDVPALGEANDAIVAYAGLVEQARANNRQGFPVGAAYQRQASALLRGDLIARLDEVEGSSRQRLNDSMSDASRSTAVAIAVLVIALGTLVGASLLLALRTRRLLNIPIAVGAALVAAALVWSATALASSDSRARDTVDTSLQAADALSRARAAAFDAKSAESLTLINRGNGASNEQAWRLADATVVAALEDACATISSCFVDEWSLYQQGHAEIRALDDGGRYDDAVISALGITGDAAIAGPAVDFAAFADATGVEQQGRAAAVESGLDDASATLGPLRWFVLVAGLAAAMATIIGFGQRLREYR